MQANKNFSFFAYKQDINLRQLTIVMTDQQAIISASATPVAAPQAIAAQVPPPQQPQSAPTGMPLPYVLNPEQGEVLDRRLKHSAWLWTANPNMRATQNSTEARNLKAKVQAAIDATFGARGENMSKFIIWMNGVEYDKIVGAPQFLSMVEHGMVNSCVHAHMLYIVTHRSKIQLDYKKMREVFASSMGMAASEVYVWTKFAKSAHVNLIDYVLKSRTQIDKVDYKNKMVDNTIAADGPPPTVSKKVQQMAPSAAPIDKRKRGTDASAPEKPAKPSKKAPAAPVYKPTKGLPVALVRPRAKATKYADKYDSDSASESESESGSGSDSVSEGSASGDERPAKKNPYGWTIAE